MSNKKITLGLERSKILFKPILTIILILLLISLLAACTTPAVTTKAPTSSAPSTTTTAPASPAAVAAKPEGELVVAVQTFGDENWLPFQDPGFANMHDLVYDLLIYWDHVNKKFYPGLAESWEVSPDFLTTTYHVRKGLQWQDGWGEFTSEDVKYTIDTFRGPNSTGKPTVYKRVESVDAPDPYTVIVHMKNPYPTFYLDLSMASSGVSQGILCKKYLETVGLDVASMKPIGTGPYRMVDSRLGDFYKFEALNSHWRVVPEFKTLTVRLVSESSTLVAGLKTKEIDLSQIPAQQLTSLKAAGIAVEASPMGGEIIMVGLGGMVIPEDKYYDAAIHNKNPWVDPNVRKAMSMAIDRQAICDAIYAGFANPAGVPLFTADMKKYQYPYDPVSAKQLLKDAGYPNGFSFNAITTQAGASTESPRIMEALVGYWQQIGLDAKITTIDWVTFYNQHIIPRKTVGEVYLIPISQAADMLNKVDIYFSPVGMQLVFEDEGSYAIYRDNPKSTFEERTALVDKLNQYYYENAGPIPVVRAGYCYAWNPDKLLEWPHHDSLKPLYLEYVRHAKPLNTFRLFSPWPDR